MVASYPRLVVVSTLDGCGSLESFSYMTNLLDHFLLKYKSHSFVYEYAKLPLLQVINKLCVMHATCHFFFDFFFFFFCKLEVLYIKGLQRPK
jgi:hypothetical protein